MSSDGWAPYFGETLKTIDWARNSSLTDGSDPVFQLINFSPGVGIAGHSMGGQSSTLAANTACTRQFDIRAVALHHPANGKTATVRIINRYAIPSLLWFNLHIGLSISREMLVPTSQFLSRDLLLQGTTRVKRN